MNLANKLNKLSKAPFTMYECENCGGIHVGRLAEEESILMYEGYCENVRELQK